MSKTDQEAKGKEFVMDGKRGKSSPARVLRDYLDSLDVDQNGCTYISDVEVWGEEFQARFQEISHL